MKNFVIRNYSLFILYLISSCKPDPLPVIMTHCDNLVTDTAGSNLPVEIFIPTAFTPNFDGLNDEFKPFTKNISSYNLQVFTASNSIIYNGSGAYMPSFAPVGNSTLYYRIIFTTTANKTIGLCGEFNELKCIPAGKSNTDYTFPDQYNPVNSILYPTNENVPGC
jgi:hypothetical protein